jgi:hypothetical protein
MRSRAGGDSGAKATIGAGSFPMIAAMSDAWLAPSKARRPVVIS